MSEDYLAGLLAGRGGGGGGKKKGPRGQYKKGDWTWILVMGMTLGTVASLAANGWMGWLASGFISTSLFLAVLYIAIRLAGIKMSEIANFGATLATIFWFWFSEQYIYPIVFKPYLGALLPTGSVKAFDLITVGGVTYTTAEPSLLIWIPVLLIAFFAIVELNTKKGNKDVPPLIMEIMAIGVGTFAVFTLIAGILSFFGLPWNLNAEWALPPLTPFTSVLWPLAAVYLAAAFGLWFKEKLALYFYIVMQILGIGMSLWLQNWLGGIFNVLILLYCYAIRSEFKNKIF